MIKYNPNILQKFRIWLFGHIKINETMKREGWKSAMQVYVVKCELHGYVRTRVTGGRRLECPKC
jgi:hypothetical protein